MKTRIELHGALREADPGGFVVLDVPAGCTIAGLRERLMAHFQDHASAVGLDLVRCSAFATSESILHDSQPIPQDGELVVLPPVGGG